MKVSAVGESGLEIGVRPWNVQGEDAWPAPRPIGRSLIPMGRSKMAGTIGDMFSNAGRFGTGLGGSLAGGVGTVGGTLAAGGMGAWNQTAGRLGAPKAPTQAALDFTQDSANLATSGLGDMGRSLTGQGTGPSAREPMTHGVHDVYDEVRSRPGVTPGVKTVSEDLQMIGETAANMIGPAKVAPGLTGAAATRGAAGYGVGTGIDLAANNLVEQAPGAPPMNTRHTLGAMGMASPVLGKVPGVGRGLAAMTHPAIAGPVVGGTETWGKRVSPLINEGMYQGVDQRMNNAAQDWIQDNPGVQQALEAQGITPDQAIQQFMSGELDINSLMPGGAGGGTQMTPEMMQGAMQGMDPQTAMTAFGVTPEAQQTLLGEIAQRHGIEPGEVTIEQIGPEVSTMMGQFDKLKQAGGGMFGKLGAFVQQLMKDPVQGLLVGGTILAALTGIIGGLAGKGNVGAMGLLAALGLGAGAYMRGPDTFKGLVGLNTPGSTEGADQVAQGAGAPTTQQLDERATDAGVEGIPDPQGNQGPQNQMQRLQSQDAEEMRRRLGERKQNIG
jgi:hypothetical protein